jgi:protein-disulfide isomerase
MKMRAGMWAQRHLCSDIDMPAFARLVLAAFLLVVPIAAFADAGDYPIMADDGVVIANHRVTPELEKQVEALPAAVVAANPNGKITLAEFYDLNCPYCRRASADIDELVRKNPDVRLVLVPFPVLGLPSILGGRVEFAVARLAPEKFYAFHKKVYEGRGTIDANRAMAAAQAVGLDGNAVAAIANEEGLTQKMLTHVKLGDALQIQATPGFVIRGVAIVGYPGPKAMTNIIAAVRLCGEVVCGDPKR